MAAKDILRAVYLVVVIGLLCGCTAQQTVAPQPNKPNQVEPLMQLSPVPNAGVSKPLEENLEAAVGQSIYVPAYSHVYYQDGREFLLATTLSIRNTSLTDPISVRSVRYYDSKGNVVKEYSQKISIPPMATTEFFVEERDTSGGSGANFIVEWTASKNVTEPVVEAVMISASSQQGISLISPGRVIKERPR